MPELTKVQTGFLEPQGAFELDPGTASAPGLFFSGNTTTGMFSPSSGVLGFSTGSTQNALTILADGKVGIGKTNPSITLDVIGGFNLTGKIVAGDESNNANFSNVLDITATSGINAYRPINFIDSSASIKLARVTDNLLNDSAVEFQTWDSTLTTNTSYWDVYGGYYGMGFRDRFSGRVGNRLFIGTGGNVLIGSVNSNGELTSAEITTNGISNILQVQGNSYISGNVGIGTTNPQALLDIYGAIADLKLTDPDTGSHTRIKQDYGTTEIINSNDSGSTRFKMGSLATEVLRIKSDGNVGIGTTNPLQKLDVLYSTIAGNRHFSTYNSNGVRLQRRNDVDGWAFEYGFLSNNGTDLGGFGGFGSSTGITNYYIGVDYQNQYLSVTSTGNVGIGTTNPTYKLHVVGSASFGDYLYLNEGVNGSSYIWLDTYFGNSIESNVNSGVTISAYPNLVLKTNYQERFRITSTGNVGIGISSPETILHIKSEYPKLRFESTNQLDLSAGTEEIGRIEWEAYKSTNYNVAASIRVRQDGTWSTITPWYSPTAIEFYTQDQSGVEVTSPRLSIKSDGNVGIGTDNPTSKLHVIGKVKIQTTDGTNGLDMSNTNIHNINYLEFSDPGAGEGIKWAGGNGWEIYESPNNLSNAAGNLQFVDSNVRILTLDTSGNAEFTGVVGIGTVPSSVTLDIYKATSTAGTSIGSTLVNLRNYVGNDLSQQKSFVDFIFTDDNGNETPQVRIGAEVGQNSDSNTQLKEGAGAFVVYTNNADTDNGEAGVSLAERFRVDYLGNVGIGTTIPSQKLHIQDSSIRLTDAIIGSILTASIPQNTASSVIVPPKRGGLIAITSYSAYPDSSVYDGTSLIYYDTGTTPNGLIISGSVVAVTTAAYSGDPLTYSANVITIILNTDSIRIVNRITTYTALTFQLTFL